MASLPDIDQQNKLQLSKIASFSGLLESDDPLIDGFLNDEAMDGNGNSSRLPQVQSSNLSHNNFSNNNDNDSNCRYEVPKQEELVVENDNKFNSLKRTLSLAYGDDETNLAKRFNNMQNNYSYNVNNNVSALLNSMQPNQTFQKQNFLSALNESQQNFRLPYIQNMHWTT